MPTASLEFNEIKPAPTPVKKRYIKRTSRDHSQAIRRTVQFAFLALNLWLGTQFVLFVKQFEGAGWSGISRPPGIEGWLPIAGLMNTRLWLVTGEVPVIHPAAMILILTFLATSLLFRKAFCGWLCPIGTVSEWLWKLGRAIFRRNFAIPRSLDIPLRGLKYLLLALFGYAVVGMSAEALAGFLQSPYGLVADVKMLNLFRFLGLTGGIVMGVLVLASVFVQNFWCRYLCPYGALMGLASLASPLRIRRVESRCIDCTLCAKACPSHLPVDRLIQIRSAECLGCMECVKICPAEDALAMTIAPRRAVPTWVIATGVTIVFVGIVGCAKWTGHWQSPIPTQIYERLIPHAAEFVHP